MIRTLRSPLVCIALGVGVFSLTSAPSGDPTSAMPVCDLSLRVEAGVGWTDRSPHRCGYISAGELRVHYLDWDGKGEVVILLPGLGSSAHVFDDFAPRFLERFRVLAVTPPAHGESSTPESGYTVDDAAMAVLAVLDSLRIRRAHLVGQSISAATITRLASRYPERVGKLVYLDGTFDLGGADEKEMDQRALPRPQPKGGISSAAEHRDWSKRYFFGTWTDALEADMWAGNVSAEEAERRENARAALLADATSHPQEYANVRAPALALWAQKTLDNHYFWVDRADTASVARARDYLENHRQPWEQKGVERFRREMKNGRVVAFPAHHWMFITDPEMTVHELQSFLLGQ